MLSPRRLPYLIVGLAAAALVAAAIYNLRSEYVDTMGRAYFAVRSAARLVEENGRRTFAASDLVVARVKAEVERVGIDAFRDSRSHWQWLSDLAASLPEEGSLWIVDGDGKLVVASIGFPTKPAILTDRHYFQAHRGGDPGPYFGPLYKGKHLGILRFSISRRIDGPGGSFGGVVLASIDATYFDELHRELGLGPGSALEVFRNDGAIFVRHPVRDQDIGKSVAASPLFRDRLPRAAVGEFEAVSDVDGVARIVAYRALKEMPLVVAAGVDLHTALASWRMTRNHIILSTSGALALLAVLAVVASRSLGREERAKQALHQANELLESRVRERTAALAEARSRAQYANEAKSRFLAAASHDLRQPLQAARLFLEVLAHRLRDTPESLVVDKAAAAMDAGEELLRALLDVSTLDAGIVQPDIANLHLARMLEDLAVELRPQAEAKGLDFRVFTSRAVVRSDRLLLLRVLRNLAINAIRYTRTGGVLVGVRRDGRHDLRIEVWDTGPGIPPDKLEAIFEDFYQLGNDERDRSKGLGLGLSIVERTARLLGHAVTVRSRPGKGSVFSVRVPLADSRGADRPTAAAPSLAET